jgi:hypothetical protein
VGNSAPRELAPECLVVCNNKFGDISGVQPPSSGSAGAFLASAQRIEPVVSQQVGGDVTSVRAKAGVKVFYKINFKTRILLKTRLMKTFLTFDYS